jgi:hypothetical protein
VDNAPETVEHGAAEWGGCLPGAASTQKPQKLRKSRKKRKFPSRMFFRGFCVAFAAFALSLFDHPKKKPPEGGFRKGAGKRLTPSRRTPSR